MKRQFHNILLAISLSSLCISAFAADQQKLSYVLGASLGHNFQAQNINLDLKSFHKGLDAAYNGKTLQYSKQDITSTLQTFQQQRMQAFVKKQQAAAQSNDKQGGDFLSKNKNNQDIVNLDNGLQYKIIKAGTGAKPSSNSTVTVDYEGRLTNGKVFDSSYTRGETATFPLNNVIKGWGMLIPKMRTGATWVLYIPAKYGYGAAGAPPMIPANAVLVFKVHLISIAKG